MTKPVKEKAELDLRKVSSKPIDDNELQDAPARLFRKLLRVCNINVDKWTVLLNDHLRWEITEKDPKEAKRQRQTAWGNIRDAYFQKPTLTFPKLLAGLSILRMKECEIIIRTRDHEGNVFEVTEKVKIASSWDLRKKNDAAPDKGETGKKKT